MYKKIILLILLSFVINNYASEEEISFKIQKIIIHNKKLIVEIADTPKAHQRGLMFRKSLADNHGMLFIFEYREILSFWMKNTYIPLDIGFFDENKKLIEYHTMKPRSLDSTTSSKEAKYALEVNKNWFKKNKIKKGMKFSFVD